MKIQMRESPRGRKTDRRVTAQIRKVLMEPAPRDDTFKDLLGTKQPVEGHGTNLDLVVRQLVKLARDGDLEATKIILDRIEGKPESHSTKEVDHRHSIQQEHLVALRVITQETREPKLVNGSKKQIEHEARKTPSEKPEGQEGRDTRGNEEQRSEGNGEGSAEREEHEGRETRGNQGESGSRTHAVRS